MTYGAPTRLDTPSRPTRPDPEPPRTIVHRMWAAPIAAKVPEIDAALRELHPYDVYELVVVDIAGGNTAYLEWISTSVAPSGVVPEV